MKTVIEIRTVVKGTEIFLHLQYLKLSEAHLISGYRHTHKKIQIEFKEVTKKDYEIIFG